MIVKEDKKNIGELRIGLTSQQIDNIKEYVEKKVNEYCKSNVKNEISVPILFGGANKDWNGTPLQCIYDYYKSNGYKDAKNEAAKYVGRILRNVLINKEDYLFLFLRKERSNIYRVYVG